MKTITIPVCVLFLFFSLNLSAQPPAPEPVPSLTSPVTLTLTSAPERDQSPNLIPDYFQRKPELEILDSRIRGKLKRTIDIHYCKIKSRLESMDITDVQLNGNLITVKGQFEYNCTNTVKGIIAEKFVSQVKAVLEDFLVLDIKTDPNGNGSFDEQIYPME